MNKFTIYEKWMGFKSHFKGNPLFFSFVRTIKYRMIRKIEIKFRIIASSVICKLKTRGIIRINDNDKKLLSLKDSHCGEMAFIIGNGPSLRSEDLSILHENKIYTFASNRINRIFSKTEWRPNCYLAIDFNLCTNSDNTLNEIFASNIDLYAFSRELYGGLSNEQKSDKVMYCNILPSDYFLDREIFGTNPALYFGNGFTVTYFAIQLAVYMGFKKICLMGVDCNYSNVQSRDGRIHTDRSVKTYFDSNYDKSNKNTAFIDGMLLSYQAAQEYALSKGIEIVNVSPSSKLEIYRKVELESFLSSQLGK